MAISAGKNLILFYELQRPCNAGKTDKSTAFSELDMAFTRASESIPADHFSIQFGLFISSGKPLTYSSFLRKSCVC
jgi:hypothetical protein